ncbi:MAG: sugar ABC transporter ATP-binding protein [Phycisphaerales bacterium]|nr:sugar ABC transporter ATP-binding protein [Phycisphaerales bacterium]
MPVASHPPFTAAALFEMEGISKSFGGQRVLREVSFDLHCGEVHVLAGENGAGKSTLMRILGGALRADAGRIDVAGRPASLRSPRDAAAHGVAIIHQELSLVGSMSIADNLFLGREPSTAGWLRRAGSLERSRALLARVGLHVDPRRTVDSLAISTQQLVEIAKALALDARIIVMDEPTSALSEPEVRHLFTRIADLKGAGCGVIYITHRLEEIYAIADRISVLRDGRLIATRRAADLPAGELVRLMVGRSMSEQAPRRAAANGDVRLRVSHCTVRGARPGLPPVVRDVSLQVHRGEILGLVGLEGSGVSELLWTIFGAFADRGTARVEIDGRPACIHSPRAAIAAGLALVTNDRKRTGLVPAMDIIANSTLATLPRLSPAGWIDRAAEAQQARESARQLNLSAASLRQRVATLSGGNQQKVVLARWMGADPSILLLDDPTRGVDVGAKHEIYLLMNRWSEQGRSIVFSSSEWLELLQVSHRIMVMHRGRVAASFEGGRAGPAELLRAAMGSTADA